MFRSILLLLALDALLLVLGHQPHDANQELPVLKSGPQAGELLKGAFQPLNINNGKFALRHHCLVTEFRLKPVAMVFVVAKRDGGVDSEVKKLLEALSKKIGGEQPNDTGLESFVVFLSPDAASGATEDKAGDPKGIIAEAKNREKLVSGLQKFVEESDFKRLIVTCCPAESVAEQYGLNPAAEVTVVVYANQRVYANFAFAQGKLNQQGVEDVLKGIDLMLDRLKKNSAEGR